MQTTVLFKTDKKLKEAAQATAKRMGIPFSAAMNNMMCEFVKKQSITFEGRPLKPTPYLKRILRRGDKDLAVGKVERFNSVEEAFADLL